MSNTDQSQPLDNQTDDDDTLDDLDPADDTPLVRKLRKNYERIKSENKKLKTDHAEELSKVQRAQEVRDMDLGLNSTQVDLLLQAHKGEFNRDEIIKTAADLKWVNPDELPDNNNTNDELTRAAGQAHDITSTSTSSSSTGIINGATVRDWPVDKMREFMDKHPADWEALKRGEEVKVSGY